MHAHDMRNSNQILHGDQTILEEIFSGSTMLPAAAKIFCDTNADTSRDLFAVANLLVSLFLLQWQAGRGC